MRIPNGQLVPTQGSNSQEGLMLRTRHKHLTHDTNLKYNGQPPTNKNPSTTTTSHGQSCNSLTSKYYPKWTWILIAGGGFMFILTLVTICLLIRRNIQGHELGEEKFYNS